MADHKDTLSHLSNTASPNESLTAPTKRPSCWQRYKTHMKKWWWLHFLVFAAVVLIVILPLVFVGFPKIAQSSINKSTLEVQNQTVTDPKPDSVQLDLNTLARSDSSLHPRIEGFSGALFLKNAGPDKPFGYLNVPEVQSESETHIDVSQRLEIVDMEQFINYNKLILASETFEFGLKGKTVVHQKGLKPFNVDYDKTITQKGLNGLKGFEIRDPEISLTPDENGHNLRGNAFIPNPSVLTLDLGNVTMTISIQGQFVGYAYLPNLVLRPGDNTIPTAASTNVSVVAGFLPSAEDGFLEFEILGNSSVNSAGEQLPYFTAAISSQPLHTRLNVLAALGRE